MATSAEVSLGGCPAMRSATPCSQQLCMRVSMPICEGPACALSSVRDLEGWHRESTMEGAQQETQEGAQQETRRKRERNRGLSRMDADAACPGARAGSCARRLSAVAKSSCLCVTCLLAQIGIRCRGGIWDSPEECRRGCMGGIRSGEKTSEDLSAGKQSVCVLADMRHATHALSRSDGAIPLRLGLYMYHIPGRFPFEQICR